MSEANQVWKRMRYESAKAYAAFEKYLTLGTTRSITEVARECNKSRGLVGRWSSRFLWVDRAALYDAHVSTIQREAEFEERRNKAQEWERERKEMVERHAITSKALFGLVQRHINKLIHNLEAEISISDLMKMLEVSSKLERLARDEPTECIVTETMADRRMRLREEARRFLRESDQTFPGIPFERRRELTAQAFGIPEAELGE